MIRPGPVQLPQQVATCGPAVRRLVACAGTILTAVGLPSAAHGQRPPAQGTTSSRTQCTESGDGCSADCKSIEPYY
jgi:hypothetical protein